MKEAGDRSLLRYIKDNSTYSYEDYDCTKGAEKYIETIESENGEIFTNNHHDYVDRVWNEDKAVGVIVANAAANETDVNHPYWYLPMICALYVRPEYRRQGIGAELVEKFLNTVERNRFVADSASEKAEKFYTSLNAEFIDLRKFKEEVSS